MTDIRKISDDFLTIGNIAVLQRYTGNDAYDFSEIIVDRHRLEFNKDTKCVTITRESGDVPFADKIRGCRMPYKVLERLLNGDSSNMEGFVWL